MFSERFVSVICDQYEIISNLIQANNISSIEPRVYCLRPLAWYGNNEKNLIIFEQIYSDEHSIEARLFENVIMMHFSCLVSLVILKLYCFSSFLDSYF